MKRNLLTSAVVLSFWIVCVQFSKNIPHFLEMEYSVPLSLISYSLSVVIFSFLFMQLEKRSGFLKLWKGIKHEKFFLIVLLIVLFSPVSLGLTEMYKLLPVSSDTTGKLLEVGLKFAVLLIELFNKFIIACFVSILVKISLLVLPKDEVSSDAPTGQGLTKDESTEE